MKTIPEHEFSTYGKGFYLCCPECDKSSWMNSKNINCGRCGYDESLKGRDYTIYKDNHGYIIDVKHPCGELIKGWSHLSSEKEAVSLAQLYIYALGEYKKPHCNNEYCLESFNQKKDN